MIPSIVSKLSKFRRVISRSEWGVILLSLTKSSDKRSEKAGLLLIQIDGLSRNQLEKALHHGRMPFITRLLKKKRYQLHTFYSGLPSSTPAVQGEIFYGIKSAVPAFFFRDRSTGKVCSMLNRESANLVESQLMGAADSILKGGSNYCDIYGGKAAESHFCPGVRGMGLRQGKYHKIRILILLVCHLVIGLRIAVLVALELGLALIDCCRGLLGRQKLYFELIFVPTRVAICILLRELVTFGVKMDLARGIPIIHVNFLGYDEQAHRRGPSSAFAHWTLKGIDGAIKHLWRASRQSRYLHYDVWIYSDHGQEDVLSYHEVNGISIQKAVNQLINRHNISAPMKKTEEHGTQYERSHWLGIPLPMPGQIRNLLANEPGVLVTAKGPIGHVYLGEIKNRIDIEAFARDLVIRCNIPLVLAQNSKGKVKAWNAGGCFFLPDDADNVIGDYHPFKDDVANDLVTLVTHPNSGDFVLSGWSPGKKPMSFPIESGAHAGPGYEETRAFILIPQDIAKRRETQGHFRPLDLHHMIKEFRKTDAKSRVNS